MSGFQVDIEQCLYTTLVGLHTDSLLEEGGTFGGEKRVGL